MMITDVMRQAKTEHEIYFLLTAYVQSVRFGDKLSLIPENLTALPLAGIEDVAKRCQQLMVELDHASRELNDKYCEVTKEALHIFGTALTRLRALEQGQNQVLSAAMQALHPGNRPRISPTAPEVQPPLIAPDTDQRIAH